jgi:CBS domain-containing protein
MRVTEVMTPNPVCCSPDTKVSDVARMMVQHDCGEIPLVRNAANSKVLVGVVTDRDIVARLIAENRNPLDATVQSCMTQPVITVSERADLDECIRLMETHQIRRVPVVDDKGWLCGIVSQADIAHHAPVASTGEMVQEVSHSKSA